MAKKKNKTETIGKIDSVKVTLAEKPYYVTRFKTGGHMTEKDRPRKKNWKKWDLD